jgi:hypothetical protein
MKKRTVLYSFVLLVFLMLFSLPIARSQTPEALIPEVAAGLNVWRLELGLGPLVYNPTLEAMAASQADYLISLPDIPLAEIHIDAQGDNARARSQRDPFNWPTYGHPELFNVTEIAAIGSVRSAFAFWTTSSVHTRSATNPTYREIGIAARSMNNLNGDVLFIVVMGGQPDVLTALPDPETGELYLTTEAAEWTGDWMGAPIQYRFLDEEKQPESDWMEWELIVPLPTDLGELFYVQYEDADGNQTEAEVRIPPVWSQFEIEQQASATESTRAPGGGGLVFVTNTPVGTPANVSTASSPTAVASPTVAPTATPAPAEASVLLLYTSRLFTLVPLANVDIRDLSFRSGSLNFSVDTWASVASDINLGALPAANCLQIWQRDAGDFAAPTECSYVRSVVFLAADRLFWAGGSFEVLNDDEVITTCQSSAQRCEVMLP